MSPKSSPAGSKVELGQQVSVATMERDVNDQPASRLARIYRSARFQVLVVSALAFCGPAMSDAIQNLGGGGAATPWAVSEYSIRHR